MKLTNDQLETLKKVYGSLIKLPIEDFDTTMLIAKEYISFTECNEVKASNLIIKELNEKFKPKTEKPTEEEINLATMMLNQEYFKWLTQEVEIPDLSPIEEKYLKEIKISPVEYIVLSKLDLIKK